MIESKTLNLEIQSKCYPQPLKLSPIFLASPPYCDVKYPVQDLEGLPRFLYPSFRRELGISAQVGTLEIISLQYGVIQADCSRTSEHCW